MSERVTINYKKVMQQIINYTLHTKSRRLYLRLSWKDRYIKDQDPLHIERRADSNYEKNTEIRKSISGLEVTLNGIPVVIQITLQKIIYLSVTEAELIVLVQCAQ